MMRRFASLAALFSLVAGAVGAGVLDGVAADVVLLGEKHDNPAHHQMQAKAVAELAPRALVFEMLTEEQAGQVTPELRADLPDLGKALGWEAGGWPDFAMYAPIFAAAPEAQIFGAQLPRGWARLAMATGVTNVFAIEAVRFGLTEPLEESQLAERLNLQMAAHCGALPLELLPDMVDVQRIRDALLAQAALQALDETGGPVVVITGNGHARTDWGVPSYIARVAPDVSVFSIGQSEDGQAPEGRFDRVIDAPGVEREDPCLAFQ